MEMEAVFKALSDQTRRLLLDRLFERDGQTLVELCEYIEMTRFGVMKHLGILEEAGLVTTRRAGREKLHYLNPVPIRLIHDRWISKYAGPWTSGLVELKRGLESPELSQEPGARSQELPASQSRIQNLGLGSTNTGTGSYASGRNSKEVETHGKRNSSRRGTHERDGDE